MQARISINEPLFFSIFVYFAWSPSFISLNRPKGICAWRTKTIEKGQKWEKMGNREKKTKKEKGRKEWEKGEKERIRRKIARKDS